MLHHASLRHFDDLFQNRSVAGIPERLVCLQLTLLFRVLGKPEPASRQWYTFDDFEQQFFTASVEQISQLIQVAEALDIRKLFLYGCQAIAERIRGKSAEEISMFLSLTACAPR